MKPEADPAPAVVPALPEPAAIGPAAPDAGRVAERGLGLVAVHLRGWLEDEVAGGRLAMARALDRRAQLTGWVERYDLGSALEPVERETLEAPLGTLPAETVREAYWRLDSLGVLAWAIGALPALPPLDAPFDPGEAIGAWPRIGEDPSACRRAARLREPEALRGALESAQLWRWRARAEATRAWLAPGEEDRLGALAGEAARRAARLGGVELVVDGDFVAFGAPYAGIADERRALLERLAEERTRALAWLCGAEADRPGA